VVLLVGDAGNEKAGGKRRMLPFLLLAALLAGLSLYNYFAF
jgi:uncharacterized membrane protein